MTKSAFLEERHLKLAERVRAFGDKRLRAALRDEADPAGRTRELVLQLAEENLLVVAVAPPWGAMDLRSVVVVRETLAYFSSLADTAFAMQGLGSYALGLVGTDVQKKRWLPAVARGEVLAAFAVTEPEAGSDLAAVRTRARPDGLVWRLRGVKTLISNAGIAGLYTVLARSADGDDHHGLSLFLVDAEAPGLVVKPLEAIAPHPLGEVRFEATPAVLLGAEGKGFGLALATLDAFRPSVGAAACGFAARAFDEALRWAQARRQFGHRLAEFQAVQMALAEMYVDLEAARLLVHRAAWLRDNGAERITREGAMAKLAATEMAQRVVDRSVQIHGGQGVMRGATVERLYREVRSLRIYEGTSEIQKLVIARDILKDTR
ncbi:MAG: acyl-CoA dehydrogenase [Acidobacteria bacterium]|nr:MAG: acyl-CoA dehydrogenase [Acidobacteriota bacterium]